MHTIAWMMAVALAGASAPGCRRDRLPPIPVEKYSDEQRQAVRAFAADRERPVFGPFVPLMRSPELMLAAKNMGDYLRFKGVLSPRIKELTILVVCREWTQQVEWQLHHPLALQAGVRSDVVEAIADGRRPSSLADDEQAAYDASMELLRIQYPIIQAPMAGGGDTPRLVAAVSEAGALGSIGAAYLTPQQIAESARAVRSLSSRPFGINLFAPTRSPEGPLDARRAVARVAPHFAELGLPAPSPPSAPANAFPEQLAAALETGASMFSFTFGMLPGESVEAIKRRGLFLAGTATTVEEALALEKAGVDAVVAQGSEAGGHRGSFAGDFEASMVGTIALVPQIADAVRVPVIASGGSMDGRGIAAALALGASAVQMGTAFLTCDEAGIPEVYKQAILTAHEDATRLTRAFSGRPARGIVNRFMDQIDREPEAILPFPLQNALTRPLRTAAAKAGRAEFLSLWAGQGLRMARREPAARLVARLAAETDAAIARLASER